MADVLMGDVALEDALMTVDWLGDNLKLLLAERTDHYLADSLLTATDKLVAPAKALADYVIFDAPPVTEVSDILPLCQHVDDLLIVTRLGRSRADQLVNLGEILTRQGVRPAGLVVVDDDLNQGSGYHYGYTPSGSARRMPRRKRMTVARD
jgi:Mrp family chromosome partitioning ATPase